MKITAAEVIDAHNALAKHGGLTVLPSASLRLARITKAVRSEIETIQEALGALETKHAIKGDDGKPLITKTPAGDVVEWIDPVAFAADRKALLATIIEMPGDPIPSADLGTTPVNSDLLAGLLFAFAD